MDNPKQGSREDLAWTLSSLIDELTEICETDPDLAANCLGQIQGGEVSTRDPEELRSRLRRWQDYYSSVKIEEYNKRYPLSTQKKGE